MNEKHIYTVKSKDSKDGHKYSQTIKWDPFTTIDVVKKDGKNSKVESQSSNPIKTSNELLWDEIKKKYKLLTIKNFIILEIWYFLKIEFVPEKYTVMYFKFKKV